jgi:hypothetical protein
MTSVTPLSDSSATPSSTTRPTSTMAHARPTARSSSTAPPTYSSPGSCVTPTAPSSSAGSATASASRCVATGSSQGRHAYRAPIATRTCTATWTRAHASTRWPRGRYASRATCAIWARGASSTRVRPLPASASSTSPCQRVHVRIFDWVTMNNIAIYASSP